MAAPLSRRGWICLSSAAALDLALGGCGRARGRDRRLDQVLVVVPEQQASWVRNFNPLVAPGSARWPTRAGIYEPLLVYSIPAGKYVPWLATAYQWRDANRELIFTLRPGVRWSDGTPFSANDVAFTFELLRREPAFDTLGVWRFVDSVQAIDAATVRFRLSRAFVPGLADIGHQPIVPQHVWRALKDPIRFTNERPIATGPFTEVTTFQSQVYELGRNPRYWQLGRPAVRAVRVPAFAGTDQANLALALGDVDWAGNFVPAIDRVFVERDRDHHEYWFPPVGGTVVMYANTARAPFGDVRLRKALSLAVDRRLIVDVAMYGYTRPADATGLSDAYAQWKNAAIGDGGWVRLDRKLAGRLLDEAGFRASPDGVRVGANGAPLRMTLQTVSGWPDWARAAQVIVQDLRKVGVVVELKTYDFGAYFDRLQRGDYELSLGWTPEGPTPYHFYRGLMASSTVRPLGERAAENWNRFANREVDALLAQFERTSDVEEQRRIVDGLSRRFAEQAPVIPLFLSVSWGECNTRRFRGFPSAKRPYARLAPYIVPECLLVLCALEPAASGRAVA